MSKARAFGLLVAVIGLGVVIQQAQSAVTAVTLNVPDRVTVATTWSTVTLPSGTEYVRIRPIAITGYVTASCTDGAALGSDYATYTADAPEVLAVHQYGRDGALCLAGSGAGTIEIWPLVRGR